MREFVTSQAGADRQAVSGKLLLVGIGDYELDESIRQLTEENAGQLQAIFAPLGATKHIPIGSGAKDEDDISASAALRIQVEAVLAEVTDQTDVILDVSSLPRITHLALLTSLLNKLVPDKLHEPGTDHPLHANGVNFQVLVAEDAKLDGEIRAEDPSRDLVLIPGFATALQAESVQDWPLVLFPVLGENRVDQMRKIMDSAMIPVSAEVCPVLPHPSKDPRRADNLLVEYRGPLFDSRRTPTSNILYAHESHPFEAYRQLLGAMRRYRDSLRILGGCRLVVTPLGSKLITIGAGLACFEMRPPDLNEKFGVAVLLAEPKRYIVDIDTLKESRPEITVLLLTGEPYA